MSNLAFSQDVALSLYSSSEDFPVDFDDAWQWLGYTRKDSAKEKLVRNFEKDIDYSAMWRSVAHSKSSSSSRTEVIVLTVDCFKSLGMMAGTPQGKQIRKYFLECEKAAKAKSLAPFWYQRLLLDHKTNAVPNGYFSIFREVIPLVADLESAGYVLPDNAVPDISVGKTWVNYLKTINVVVEQIARQYPHTYPDQRGVQYPKCYPESMLPTFRQWFREKYKVDHLQRYMKTKDKASLPAVDKIVRALMAG